MIRKNRMKIAGAIGAATVGKYLLNKYKKND